MLNMITINLLPAEYRPAEGTPLTRFIVLIVGVVILLVAVLGFTFMRMALKDTQENHTAKENERVRVAEEHKEFVALEELRKKYDARGKTIEGIRFSRIRWGIKLMQFYDFFALDAFTKRMWIDGLTIKMDDKAKQATARKTPGKPEGPAAAGTVEFTLNSAGGEFTAITDFRETLTGQIGTQADLELGKAFWADFMNLNDPAPSRESARDMEPEVYYSEEMKFEIKPREVPSEKKPAAPARPAQAPGGNR